MALIEYNPPLDHPYLDIIYQDNHLCVVNKPSGLLSVPGNQPQYYDSAMSRVKEKFGFCEPAHRLDMATSGIIVFDCQARKANRSVCSPHTNDYLDK